MQSTILFVRSTNLYFIVFFYFLRLNTLHMLQAKEEYLL
jgi:hypothetical protein